MLLDPLEMHILLDFTIIHGSIPVDLAYKYTGILLLFFFFLGYQFHFGVHVYIVTMLGKEWGFGSPFLPSLKVRKYKRGDSCCLYLSLYSSTDLPAPILCTKGFFLFFLDANGLNVQEGTQKKSGRIECQRPAES